MERPDADHLERPLRQPVYIFGFFCAMMVLQLVWVTFFVPETKGQSLEHMKLS